MVEKFRIILDEIKRSKGEVFLFAIMKMDDLTDKWSVILSAPWAKEGDIDVFRYLFELLKNKLSDEEDSIIARIGIFPKKDHLIELLLKYTDNTTIEGQKINGNIIHEGYILESNPNLDKEIHQKSLLSSET